MILWKNFRAQIPCFALAAMLGLLCSQKKFCIKGLSATGGFAYRGWGRKPDWIHINNPSEKKGYRIQRTLILRIDLCMLSILKIKYFKGNFDFYPTIALLKYLQSL